MPGSHSPAVEPAIERAIVRCSAFLLHRRWQIRRCSIGLEPSRQQDRALGRGCDNRHRRGAKLADGVLRRALPYGLLLQRELWNRNLLRLSGRGAVG